MATTQPREKSRLAQRRLPGNKTPTKVQKQDHQTPRHHRHPQHLHRKIRADESRSDNPGRHNGDRIRHKPEIMKKDNAKKQNQANENE